MILNRMEDLSDRNPHELQAISSGALEHKPLQRDIVYLVIETALAQAEACIGDPVFFYLGSDYRSVAEGAAEGLVRTARSTQLELHNNSHY